jgi:membrane protein DedA with SNARE-associated domain
MGQLNIGLLFAVFMTSAVLGDAVNYAIGSKLGEPASSSCGSIERFSHRPGHLNKRSQLQYEHVQHTAGS